MSIRIPVKLPGASQAERSLSGLDKQTDALTKSQRTLKKTTDRTSKSLGGLADKADEAGSAAKEAGDDAERGMSGVPSATKRAEAGMDSYAQSARRAQAASSGLSRGAKSTATNLSFELTQATADAKFGLVGLANQIPLISEQFTRLQSRTGSTSGALGALFSAIKGPTGIIAALTLLLTFKDEIVGFFSSFTEGAETAEEKTKALKEATSQLLNVDLGFDTKAIDDLDRARELLGTIQGQITEIEGLESLQEKFESDRPARVRTRDAERVFDQVEVAQELVASGRADSFDELGDAGDIAQALQESGLTLQDLREQGLGIINEELEARKAQLPVLRQQEKRLQAQINQAETLRSVYEQLPQDLRADDEEEETEDSTSSTTSTSSGFTPRAQEAARAFGRLRSELALINLKPFLDDTQKSARRVELARQEVERLQAEGKLLSEEALKGFIQDLGLSQQEAQELLQALRGTREEASRLERAKAQAQNIDAAGVLPEEEAIRRKRNLYRQARDAAIQAGNVDEARAAQVQLDALPKRVEEETAGAFEQGFSSGLQSGINQELQPLFDTIENDFARALISAMAQAVVSDAAKELSDVLFNGSDGSGLLGLFGSAQSGPARRPQAALGLGGTATSGAAKTATKSGAAQSSGNLTGLGRAGLGAGLGTGLGQGVQQASGSKVAGALTGAATAGLIAATGGAGIPLILGAAALGGLGGFFADGGRPPVGKPSVVGERGPELFVPDEPGTIVPNGALRAPSLPPIPSGTGVRKAIEDQTRRLEQVQKSVELRADRRTKRRFVEDAQQAVTESRASIRDQA